MYRIYGIMVNTKFVWFILPLYNVKGVLYYVYFFFLLHTSFYGISTHIYIHRFTEVPCTKMLMQLHSHGYFVLNDEFSLDLLEVPPICTYYKGLNAAEHLCHTEKWLLLSLSCIFPSQLRYWVLCYFYWSYIGFPQSTNLREKGKSHRDPNHCCCWGICWPLTSQDPLTAFVRWELDLNTFKQ